MQIVSFLPLLSGISDDVYIEGVKNIRDKNNKQIYDTVILNIQPEASCVFATEILALNYDGTANNFFTKNPINKNYDKCEIIQNNNKNILFCSEFSDCFGSL